MKVGDIIRTDNRFIRTNEWRKDVNWKIWQKESIEACDVIFLGIRHLNNGPRHWDSDCGYTYYAKEKVVLALVIKQDGRTNPFYTEIKKG